MGTFNDPMKTMGNVKWGRFNAVKAIGDKKRVFTEYVQELKKAEKQQIKAKLEKVKELKCD